MPMTDIDRAKIDEILAPYRDLMEHVEVLNGRIDPDVIAKAFRIGWAARGEADDHTITILLDDTVAGVLLKPAIQKALADCRLGQNHQKPDAAL